MKTRPMSAPASARVEFQVRFEPRPKGRGRITGKGAAIPPEFPPATSDRSTVPARSAAAPDVPKLTQLLDVAYWWERLIAEGKVKDYAEIARLTGLSRARVTQITNLAVLPSDLQNRLLLSPNKPSDGGLTEGRIRCLGARTTCPVGPAERIPST